MDAGNGHEFELDHMLISDGSLDGESWLRPVTEIDTENGRIVSHDISEWLNYADVPAARTFNITYIPPLSIPEPTPVMQVPYYWQDFLPWCVPTSLAMVVNYHDGGLAGVVSNYFLSGEHEQDRNDGAWGNEVIKSAGASDDFFENKKWDGDPYNSGHFWSDEPGSPTLTDDDTFGHAIGSSQASTVTYEVRIDNVTSTASSYDLTVDLRDSTGSSVQTNYHNQQLVDAYTRGSYINDSFFGLDLDAGVYTLFFELSLGGDITDIKTVNFKIE